MSDKKIRREVSATVPLVASEIAEFLPDLTKGKFNEAEVSIAINMTASAVAEMPVSALAQLPISSLAELVVSAAAALPASQVLAVNVSSIVDLGASALVSLPSNLDLKISGSSSNVATLISRIAGGGGSVSIVGDKPVE